MQLRMMMTGFFALLLAACGGDGTGADTSTNAAAANAEDDTINLAVYKDPNCGCCGAWITYADERGFKSEIIHPEDLNLVKQEFKIGPQYQSCHTSVTDEGFVFEGHIPVKYIRQFLAEKPENAIGLAVPGMPLGSPGMEVEDRFMPYDVLLLKDDGTSEVYARVEQQSEQY